MNYRDVHARAMESHAKRQHMYARGGKVHDDEKEDRALVRSMVKKEDLKPKRADGGAVEGRARGGKTDRPHGKTVVNVIAPGGAPAMPMRPPMPPPMMAGGPPPHGAPGLPPRPVGGLGPAPGPMMPPGAPMRARGGRASGGDVDDNMGIDTNPKDRDLGNGMMQHSTSPRSLRQATPPQRDDKVPVRARGGKMTGGAMSGVGREEKAEGGIKGPMIARA